MPEPDFLTQIRTAEQTAAQWVERARDDARRAQEEAREQAAVAVADAHVLSRQIQQDMTRAAEQEAEQIRNDASRAVRAEADALAARTEDRLPEAARAVAERIVSGLADR